MTIPGRLAGLRRRFLGIRLQIRGVTLGFIGLTGDVEGGFVADLGHERAGAEIGALERGGAGAGDRVMACRRIDI